MSKPARYPSRGTRFSAEASARTAPSSSPTRLAEAQLTKAVLAARDGSPVTALELAGAALNHERRSQPSLLLVASEVAHELEYRSPADGAEFRNHLRTLSAPDSPPR